MIISRELDYAVRIIRQLNKTKISNAAQIETAECMSRDFARKILGKLKKADIVSAERGTNGGYYLKEYSRSETRNGQLNSMKEAAVFQKPDSGV